MPQIVQPIDWVSASKTFTLVLAFLGCIAAILTGHDTPDINTLTWGLGASLGILRLTDTVANLVTVRSYLANPNTANLSGLTPLPTSTPLVQTQNGVH